MLVAGRYERDPAQDAAADVVAPARDRVTGATVSILAEPVLRDTAAAIRELDRLRRAARVRHPALAAVRDVVLDGDRVTAVCAPLSGTSPTEAGPLPVPVARRVATDLLEALAALHRAGVVHGAVGPSSVVLSPAPDVRLTLLPVATDGSRPDEATPADDVRDAVAFLGGLLGESAEEVLGPVLARAREHGAGITVAATAAEHHPAGDTVDVRPPAYLTGTRPPAPTTDVPPAADTVDLVPGPGRAGDTVALPAATEPSVADGGGSGVPARAEAVPAPDVGAVPAELDLSAIPAATPPSPAGTAPRRGDGGAARRRARRRRVVVAVLVLALLVVAAVVVVLVVRSRGGPAAGAASTTPPPPTDAASSTPPPTVTTTAPASPPQTVDGMVGALAPDPTAAGPAGPQLLDSLRGLQSTDDTVRQRAAFGLGAVLLDGTGLDPAYATAARVALARSLVGPGAPSAGPAGSATCLRVTGGSPSPVVQEYARQVLDRVPAWQDGGLPADQAQRLRALLGPVSAGSATLTVTSCPPA